MPRPNALGIFRYSVDMRMAMVGVSMVVLVVDEPAKKLGGGGENCTPDYLLCEQMPCCLGYAAFENECDAACESALDRK